MNYQVFIPHKAPGFNQTYGYGKGRVYLTEKAEDWSAKAALIIGARAGVINWKKTSKYYGITVYFTNLRQDVDAPIKLVIDTLTRKLGFNDGFLLDLRSKKVRSNVEGVYILLYPLAGIEYIKIDVETQEEIYD